MRTSDDSRAPFSRGAVAGEIVVPLDTATEAHDVQREAYRTMGGAARVAIAFRLGEAVRQLALAGIRSRHPEYSDQQVLYAWIRLKLGDDLVRAVWPDRELIDP